MNFSQGVSSSRKRSRVCCLCWAWSHLDQSFLLLVVKMVMIQAVKIAQLFAAVIVQVHVKEHLLQVDALIVADLVKAPALVPVKEVHPTLVVRVAHPLVQTRVRMNVALHAQEDVRAIALENVPMDARVVAKLPAQESVRVNVKQHVLLLALMTAKAVVVTDVKQGV